MLKKLWNDESGIVTLEYLVLATFLALAVIVGVATVGASLNAELTELAGSILTFSQEYNADGFSTCAAQKEGSAATDVAGTVGASSPTVTGTAVDIGICP